MRLLTSTLATLICVAPCASHAIPLTYTFGTTANATAVGGGIADPFILSMTVDSETPDQAASDVSIGRYNGTLSVTLGSQTATSNGQIIIENDRDIGGGPRDRFSFFGTSYFTGFFGSLFDQVVLIASMEFLDNTGTALPNDGLNPINLNNFQTVSALLGFGTLQVRGPVLSPIPQSTPIANADFNFTTSVPEPSSLLLLGVGLVGMAVARRRRSLPRG